MTSPHPTLRQVTDRIRARSVSTRAAYLATVAASRRDGSSRARVSCTNLAHAFAAETLPDKILLRELRAPNVAIVSSYNDMLSAHQPFERFPAVIKQALREAGAVAQFAGGVPAMCDGVRRASPGWS
jgi:phosphogluconate dehydratase